VELGSTHETALGAAFGEPELGARAGLDEHAPHLGKGRSFDGTESGR
jgi:hypothetical protein